jgi:outer membrane lipoprotein SlyB
MNATETITPLAVGHQSTVVRTRLQLAAAALAVASATLLCGCAATQVALTKRDLDVQTRMSATIFLDPVKSADRTIFVQVRNTSDKPDLDIASDISQAVAAKGYTIVGDPGQAHYYLQANVLYVGKSSPTASQQALGQGYGGPLAGAVTGMVASSALGGYGGRDIAAAALAGGLVESVSGALVKDVYYSIVTDIQVKERVAAGRTEVRSDHRLVQGTSGSERVSYTDTNADMRAYQTRVVSTANKANLDFQEAVPSLRSGLTRALAGLF